VLLLMGQHPLGSMGREIQQEVPSSIFDNFVKWKGTMSRIEDIPAIMRRAFTNLRSGSPGPVVLEMPQDVLLSEAPDEILNYEPVGPGRRAAPDAGDIERAADILLNARLPIMNVGGGVLAAEAWDEALELAELMAMPVASTLVGKGAFPENHPLALGGGAYPKSRYASGQALVMNRKADAVLAVGNSFRLPNATDGRPIPEGVQLIHINADSGDLNKIYQADVPILADAKLALASLVEAVRDRLGPGRGGIKEEIVSEIAQARDKWLGEWESVFNDPSTPTNGYRVVQELRKLIDPDRTIALHDAGGSRGYLSPFWPATRPRNYIGMGGMAAMGWSMGATVGAKLGRQDHLVFHVIGDASFGMVGMEVETSVRMGLPTLTVLLNNGGTGGGLMAMERPNAAPPAMAELGGNFSMVAQGLGAYSERVEDPNEITPALRRCIQATESGQAALIEVLIRPMPTPEAPDNWSL
jgi:acetolactate synthase-1/2/3 large subunit